MTKLEKGVPTRLVRNVLLLTVCLGAAGLLVGGCTGGATTFVGGDGGSSSSTEPPNGGTSARDGSSQEPVRDPNDCTNKSQCPKGCFDLQTDPQNCGSCGFSCPSIGGGSGICQEGVCASTCPTTLPYPFPYDPTKSDTQIGSAFKPHGPRQDACTGSDIQQLQANIEGSSATVDDLKLGLSDACIACVFTQATDARWGPIVLAPFGKLNGVVNPGACWGTRSGKTSCGRARYHLTMCITSLCRGCETQPNFEACREAATATGGACAAAKAAVSTECPDESALSAQCDDFIEGVAYVCQL